MDTKVILVIASIIVVLLYVSYDTERKRKLKLEKRLKKSWGNPSWSSRP